MLAQDPAQYSHTSIPVREIAEQLEERFGEALPAGCARHSRTASFVVNDGQWDPRIQYACRVPNLALLLEQDGIAVDLHQNFNGSRRGIVMRLQFETCQSPIAYRGVDRLPGLHNFMIGRDSAAWRSGVPSYTSVRGEGLYPGIDLELVDRDGMLHYDLHCAPGADLDRVVIACSGVDRLSIDEAGRLRMHNEFTDLVQTAPVAWNVIPGGTRIPVDCKFRLLDDSRYGFSVSGADPRLPLVIDPGLTWVTYIGGDGIDELAALHRTHNVQVAGGDALLIGGRTNTVGYPVTLGPYGPLGGTYDAFITCLDPAASGVSQLLWSTKIGGDGDHEHVLGITSTAWGDLVICGATDSGIAAAFPVTQGAYQTVPRMSDAFVMRLASNGSQIHYSTLFGGSDHDYANRIHVSKAGVFTICGDTKSSDLPLANPLTTSQLGGTFAGLLARINPGLPGATQLRWSTYIAGQWPVGFYPPDFSLNPAWFYHEAGGAMHVDGNGVVTWATQSDGPIASFKFPFLCPGQQGNTGNMAIARFDPSKSGASQLIWDRRIGGCDLYGWDIPEGLDVDDDGSTVISGCAFSTDFPTTPGAFSPRTGVGRLSSMTDGVLVKLDPTGQTLLYSSFLGTTSSSLLSGARIDDSGHVVCVGFSKEQLPTTGGAPYPLHSSFPNSGSPDGLLMRIDPAGNGLADLKYLSMVPGDGVVQLLYVALGERGEVYAMGSTDATDVPVTNNAYQIAYGGGTWDGVLLSSDMLPAGVERYGQPSPPCADDIHIGAVNWASRSQNRFYVSCAGAPPGTAGVIGGGFRSSSGVPVSRMTLWVDPVLAVQPVISDSRGLVEFRLPIPSSAVIGTEVAFQFAWLGGSVCPVKLSDALEVTVQF